VKDNFAFYAFVGAFRVESHSLSCQSSRLLDVEFFMRVRPSILICTFAFLMMGCPSSSYTVSALDATEDVTLDEGVVVDLVAPPEDTAPQDVVADEGEEIEEDVPEEKDFPVWDPDWTNHSDNVIQKCLELIPEICNKMWDCEGTIIEQFAGLCPALATGAQDVLIDGCEELVQNVGPEGLAGKMLKNLAFSQLANCIEDYECTQENIAELMAKLMGGFGGGGSGGGDPQDGLAGALPQLLGVILEECGTGLPFGF
jgi:hypothetical protein